MKLLVAIHDVTPAFAEQAERLWNICAARGVAPALFVVPRWHGEWRLEEHSDFVHWLREREDDGAEVFLHGERHDESGLRRTWRDELRAFGRTDGEGEFLTLRPPQATWRIHRGLECLRALGLSPIGFVAPAWLWRSECVRVVAEAGLRVSEDEFAVHLHERGMRLDSPVLRWSARTAVRAWGSTVLADARSWWHRAHWLVRIALHPRDLSRTETARSVERTLDRWLAVRLPWRYGAL